MDWKLRVRRLWRHFGWPEKLLLLLTAAYAAADFGRAGPGLKVLLLMGLTVAAVATGIKWLHRLLRQAVWSLRNRLLVAYVFIAVVPVLLVGAFAMASAWVLAGQISVHLVSTEFNRRLTVMKRAAESLAQMPTGWHAEAWKRVLPLLEADVPRPRVLVTRNGALEFPDVPPFPPPPPGWHPDPGIVIRGGVLHLCARAQKGPVEVTLVAPITRSFLLSLAPGLGDVTILEFDARTAMADVRSAHMRLHAPLPSEPPAPVSAVPPPKNRFDFEFKQGTSVPVTRWGAPAPEGEGLLSVHSRFSAVLDVLSREKTNTGILVLLYVIAAVFLLVEVVSLIIGVSLTRTITGAFQNLYEGTQRVSAGDFSHRVEVRGRDQLAEVAASFNKMTEEVERLLGVAKEKERMQAELEIAREVQRQLYPKSAPKLTHLELYAVCKPARTVSGDYYDYQTIDSGRVIVAMGDVAGKGISAALLMATLQSSLRAQVRHAVDGAGGDGRSVISTSALVARLNEQLYSDTSPEKYATFFFSVYDDSKQTLIYTNAGHLPPLLFRKGEVTPLDVNGMVVGAFPFAQYGESRLELEPGDLLLTYTDGITEPENEYGEMFGEQRLVDLVQRHADEELEGIVRKVMEAVEEWTGSPELQDDMTILVARRS